MTTVSILVPHYNDPAGFALSLRSIEEQTWSGDREIILADDGSDPRHIGKLEDICGLSSERIRLIRNEHNRGRPYTRNVLLDAADGKYTAWLDAGDEWYPRKLELQISALYRARFLEFGRDVWCTSHYDWQWAGGKKRARTQNLEGDQLTNILVGSLAGYLWTILGPTESFKAVGYFDLELPRLQDLDFFLRFLSKGGMLVLPQTDEPLAVYHKSDIGKNGAEVLRCFKRVFHKHSGLLMTRTRRFRRNRQFHIHMHAARFTNNNNDLPRTALYLAQSALHNPIAFVRHMVKNKGLP